MAWNKVENRGKIWKKLKNGGNCQKTSTRQSNIPLIAHSKNLQNFYNKIIQFPS